jgi:UDP-N-acetylmuramate: L-alanyl-gamma-D-glutamyl-meso-diaminopimelate ligase
MPKNKAHLIGICGAGMAALAILLRDAGYEVTGSDEEVFPPISDYLRENNINFTVGHKDENIPADATLIVIGKHSGLAEEDNAETMAAIKSGIKVVSLPVALAMLSTETENILAVGSFGKSTMSALLAYSLTNAGIDTSYFIGALPIDLKNSSHVGKAKEFVLEGDEYPSSNTDISSKFLHLNPAHVILTSGEHDHVNIFPTETSYIEPYKKLVAKIPSSGLLVYAKNGKNNTEIIKSSTGQNISYGVDDAGADWYAENVKYGMETTFDLANHGNKIVSLKTTLLGKHNIENIVGAGALLLETKKVNPEAFAKAITSFHGIKRRIELINNNLDNPVYEGFGSSFEKTRAIFDALHLHFPNRRLVCVFEPHAFSWRNRNFIHWYKKIFEGVDEVIMLPAVSRGKKDADQLDTPEIWAEAKKHFPIQTASTENEALQLLKKIVKKSDIIAFVSSGPMLGLTKSIPKLF